jgi:putative DNA primase/helicase
MADLFGVPAPDQPTGARPETADIDEPLAWQALEAAEAATDPKRHDELLEAALASIARLGELQRARLKPEFCRVAGVTSKKFDGMLSAATGEKKNTAPYQSGEDHRPTDDELRDRWLSRRQDVAYGLGEFRAYSFGIWRPVPLDGIRDEVMTVLEAAKANGIRPTAGRLTSVLELARIKVSVPDQKWDADPNLLVCANGTLNIVSRELLAHAPEHRATSAVPYAYDPNAEAGTWQFYLATTIPDIAPFLQEFSGYCLTTDTSHELAIWLFGPAGSGKSTFIIGLQAMLGPRAGALGLADIERSQFALAALPGKTLVVATEQPALYIRVSNVLNSIISGETIVVERKYQDAILIKPRAKILWAMNELPRVDAGNGLFRRVRVVRFPAREEEQNPTVKELIATEGAGILNWALDGLARLRARGRFEVPEQVEQASEHFRSTNDVPALFVSQICSTGPEYRTQSADLYEAYRTWCKANGHREQSSTSMADEWERLGFSKIKAAGRAYWIGVGLVEPSQV